MKFLTGCLCLFALTPTWGAGDITKVPVSIFCTNYADELKSVFLKSGNDGFRAVGLSTANVIDASEVDVIDGKIFIHGPDRGVDPHPIVAIVDVAGIKEPLIVLSPPPTDDEKGSSYQSTVVEGALAGFPMGGFMFVNLSPHSVRLTMDKEIVEIESGSVKPFKSKAKAGEVLPVTIDYRTGDAWHLMSSARWAARNDRRTLVCIQLDPSSKRMIVKSIPLRANLK